jgi:GNAT superfamily N-acetyltransferase
MEAVVSKKTKKQSCSPEAANAVEVRKATIDDVGSLADMMMDSHRDPIFAEIAETQREYVEKWFTALVSTGNAAIAMKDGKPIGAVVLVVFPLFYHPAHIVAQSAFWWVSREHRGSGTGRELMKHGEEIARELGASVMLWTARKDSAGAARLCLEHGYKLGESYYWRRM